MNSRLFLQIRLIASQIFQALRRKQGSTSVFKGDFHPKNSGRLIREYMSIGGHNRTTIVGHKCEVMVCHDRNMDEQRSRFNQAAIAW